MGSGTELSLREKRIETAVLRLSDRELAALRYWQASTDPELSPVTQAELFQLYLTGRDTEEIRKLYPTFSLGHIVHAKVFGDWDAKRDEYREQLLSRTAERMQQAQLESCNTLADWLFASNTLIQSKLQRYNATRDEKELDGLAVTDPMGFKRLLESMKIASGRDAVKQVNVSGTIKHDTPAPDPNHVDIQVVDVTPILDAGRPANAQEAAATIRGLLAKKDKENEDD